jgi:hypothetical protein
MLERFKFGTFDTAFYLQKHVPVVKKSVEVMGKVKSKLNH